MKHIMIIDDENDIREVLGHFLQENGFRVSAFQNGKEAIENVTEVKPDLILVDLIMPLVDGFEFIRRIHKAYPQYPIVVLSGYIEKETEDLIMTIGAKGFIKKPVVYAGLITAIQKMTEKAG